MRRRRGAKKGRVAWRHTVVSWVAMVSAATCNHGDPYGVAMPPDLSFHLEYFSPIFHIQRRQPRTGCEKGVRNLFFVFYAPKPLVRRRRGAKKGRVAWRHTVVSWVAMVSAATCNHGDPYGVAMPPDLSFHLEYFSPIFHIQRRQPRTG